MVVGDSGHTSLHLSGSGSRDRAGNRLVINPKAYPSPDPQSLRMPPPAGSQVSKWKSVGDILPPHYIFLHYFRISEF